MSRSLKFRAWDKNKKTMFFPKEFHFTTGLWGITLPDGRRISYVDIMQFIGIIDRRDQEIYESDIVRDTDSKAVGVVVWDELHARFAVRFQDKSIYEFYTDNGRDNSLRVIGNVWEHPDLLKEPK
jgi:hypothetical protein